MLLIWLGAVAGAATTTTIGGTGGGGRGHRRLDDLRIEYERIKARRIEAKSKRAKRDIQDQEDILAALYQRARLDAQEREAEEILLLLGS